MYQQHPVFGLFLKRHILQLYPWLKENHRTADFVPHSDRQLLTQWLEGILAQVTAIVIAVHPFAGRGAEQHTQALLDVLFVSGHFYTIFCQHRRKAPSTTQERLVVQPCLYIVHCLILLSLPSAVLPLSCRRAPWCLPCVPQAFRR